MRDCKLNDYEVKTKVIIEFFSKNYISGTDEMDAKAKSEFLIRSAVKFGFDREINLKLLVDKNITLNIQTESIAENYVCEK